MYREDSLYADAVGNSAYGESLGNTRALASNNRSLESLNSFSLALADLNGNLYGVADIDERGAPALMWCGHTASALNPVIEV